MAIIANKADWGQGLLSHVIFEKPKLQMHHIFVPLPQMHHVLTVTLVEALSLNKVQNTSLDKCD